MTNDNSENIYHIEYETNEIILFLLKFQNINKV